MVSRTQLEYPAFLFIVWWLVWEALCVLSCRVEWGRIVPCCCWISFIILYSIIFFAFVHTCTICQGWERQTVTSCTCLFRYLTVLYFYCPMIDKERITISRTISERVYFRREEGNSTKWDKKASSHCSRETSMICEIPNTTFLIIVFDIVVYHSLHDFKLQFLLVSILFAFVQNTYNVLECYWAEILTAIEVEPALD